MKISSISIPKELVLLLEEKGYRELYPPQEEAVRQGVLEGARMLITTPTASGKTLIAILTAAKTILETGGKVVYLTPLRALASEKYEEFRTLERLEKPDNSKIKVLISTGDYDSSGESLGRGDILVLTNEKFDSVLRHGVSWLGSVTLFVVDEVHLVGETDRGSTIEMILAKILAYAPKAQILALSATVQNGDELADWIDAKLVNLQWRPVQLVEGIYDYSELHFTNGVVRKILTTNRGFAIDAATDTLSDGGQALIFAETRKRAVSLALKASEVTRRYLSDHDRTYTKGAAEAILTVAEETELSRNLARAVENGAAFHHAGLHAEHRRIVEESFRLGFVKILTATPTLAAGVNLPARRVVIANVMRFDSELGGQAPISVLDYKQMCGRAGRPQFDTYGETVIIASSQYTREELFYQYIKGTPEPVRSKLSRDGPLRAHLLATVASFPGLSQQELENLFQKTLFARQSKETTVKTKLSSTSEYLLAEGLIEKRGSRFIASELGKRISILYIDPATGVEFKRAITRSHGDAPNEFGILHLIVSVPNFTPRLSLRNKDFEEAVLIAEQNKNDFLIPTNNARLYDPYEGPLRDFRSLMVLRGWIDEWKEDRLLEEFGVEPGDLYRAVDNSDWLLYSLAEIAKLLGSRSWLPEINSLRQRVRYGVKPELLQLVQLEGIGRVRARSIYSHGITTLEKLASMPTKSIAEIPKIGEIVAKKIKNQLSIHRA